MSDDQLVEKLAHALAQQLRPAIPVAVDLWDVAMVAQYLKRGVKVARERIVCLPDFPKSIRLPSTGSGRAHSLWRASEVIAWAETYRDKSGKR